MTTISGISGLADRKDSTADGGAANAACPLCGGPLSPAVSGSGGADGRVYDILYCGGCAVGRTFPFPRAEDLALLYAPGEYRSEGGARFNRIVEALIAWSRRRRGKRIEARVPTGALLDVGCGRGLFLDIMRRRGWRVAGVEFDEPAAERVRKAYGVDVRSGGPSGWGFPPASFDAVTMSHSLEHMPDPGGAVAACARLLRPGGILAVAVPNLASYQAAAGGGGWFHLDPPHHLHHFTEEGLARLLAREGLAVVRVRRFDAEYNPYGWLQTLLNLLPIRKNLLYDLLKGKGRGAGAAPAFPAGGVLGSLVLLPLAAPLALLLSLVEACVPGRSGTVELFATTAEPGGAPPRTGPVRP